MKVVILAGGLGTRISEESHLKPKPMIEIGGKPILWHIMKIYASYGYNEFVICAGYRQDVIKGYFANYYTYNSDVTFDLSNNSLTVHSSHTDNWKVSVVDTGYLTMTGGRVKRIRDYVGGETFFLTYGDAVADIDLPALLKFHKESGKILTITAANIAQMKGVLNLAADGQVESFREKEDEDSMLINGGFMVAEPEIFDYLAGDETVFEKEPMQRLAAEGQMMAYLHEGFWQCMDTQREMKKLEDLWATGNAPWKIWENR
ncbi:MAG: glucose-1-phosphate cytidylyltransferase [Lachnospiraceae bacterium]|nr:glucose-1-phosphate cytidylyltransferase [Lachnospiraceae bacterium]